MPLRDPLVTDDPRTWPASRRLDAVVAAELVAMQYPARMATRSRWSSDARAVGGLIDELTSEMWKGEPWEFMFTCSAGCWPKWQCEITGNDWVAEGHGETLALAFCRAFLHKAPKSDADAEA